jgi:hypothetical protein
MAQNNYNGSGFDPWQSSSFAPVQKFPPILARTAHAEARREIFEETLKRELPKIEAQLEAILNPQPKTIESPKQESKPMQDALKVKSFDDIKIDALGRHRKNGDKRHNWTGADAEKMAEVAAQKMFKQNLRLPDKNEKGEYETSPSLTRWLLPIFIAAQNECVAVERRKRLTSFVHLDVRGLLESTQRHLALLAAAKELPAVVAPINGARAPEPVKPPEPPPGEAKAALENFANDEALLRAFIARFGRREAEHSPQLQEAIDLNKELLAENDLLNKRLDQFEQRLSAFEKNGRREEAQLKAKLKTVAILGLYPDQVRDIEQKTKEAKLEIDLRFIDTRKTSPHDLHTDYCMTTRQTLNDWADYVRRSVKPGQYLLGAGSPSAMMNQLFAWFQ